MNESDDDPAGFENPAALYRAAQLILRSLIEADSRNPPPSLASALVDESLGAALTLADLARMPREELREYLDRKGFYEPRAPAFEEIPRARQAAQSDPESAFDPPGSDET